MKRRQVSAPNQGASHPWEVPSHWLWAEIEQVGAVQLGKQLTQDHRPGDVMVKYLRAGNITPIGVDVEHVNEMGMNEAEILRYTLRDGDVLLAEASGSPEHVGRSAVWRGEIPNCCFQNTVIRFRPHAVSADYAHLVFRCFLMEGIFSRAARGVGIQHLGADRFAQLEFPVAPISTQKEIVAELVKRLAGIDDARRSLESAVSKMNDRVNTLLEMAATGQLKGVKVELKAAQRSDELPLADAPDDKDDDLLVPRHWRVIRVGEAGEVRLGRQRTPAHERGNNIVPYLRVANVFEDRIDANDVLKMNFTPAEQEIYRLKDGDILLNEGQSPELVGRPALYRGEPPEVCFQNTLVRFRAGKEVDPRYALLVFRHYLRSGRFARIARGSTNIAHLGAARFANLPFPCPPLDEQRSIAEFAEQQLSENEQQASAVRASLAKLGPAELELLRSAFRGELVAEDRPMESAREMLARVGPPPKPEIHKSTTPRANSPMKNRRKKQDLASVLRSVGRSLTAEELFELAGYDRDDTDEIEQFYLTLRAELNKSIRKVDRNRLEVI